MASVPRLVLCEEKIREKGGLAPHRDLAELQSLSVPGTYQEKITHLGTSLMKLTGLRSLDLSRNSLVSLEGIQYLTALESLNLYYNSISSLSEVFRLHCLTELRDVDFRLNPVVKSESDYRLFVLHMLPRLQQLDDRPVRDSERKASKMHFASEDSVDSRESFPAAVRAPRSLPSQARCTDTSAKKCLVMDADDEAVLNLIAECEWDLSNPPRSSSSSQRERETDLHSTPESDPLAQHQCGDSVKKGQEPFQRKGSSRGICVGRQPQDHHCGELPAQFGSLQAFRVCGPHGHFTPHPGPSLVTDSVDVGDLASSSQKSSLSAPKVPGVLPTPEKFRKWRMPGGRFQAPSDQESLSCLEEGLSRLSEASEGRGSRAFSLSEASEEVEEPRAQRTNDAREPSPRVHLATAPGTRTALEVAFLGAILDLVDRYWSGCKSLHSNEAFLAQARHILSSVPELTVAQDTSAGVSEDMNFLTLENKSLQNHLAEQQQQHAQKMSEVMSELHEARQEMGDLKQHLDKSLEENSSLKSLLFSMKQEMESAEASVVLNSQITGLQTSVKLLSEEVVELKQHLERYDQIQELTHMLQESHSSLVSTNEHLLQELSQARAQHRAEVEQMHWSYQELKKTMALFPRCSASPGGRQSC
ncbi:centrosomal protein of 72 kDa isoform X2 [Ochotona princeps]|uniref:centrosomal protein of 72 kDa isoform X2 n=1 Tax=Ochotona princeps TaxID=9978 RepID=UPI002714EF97|nr:centrosomal protein of 72 kDa isoform X2 [Ochotona princeps]